MKCEARRSCEGQVLREMKSEGAEEGWKEISEGWEEGREVD